MGTFSCLFFSMNLLISYLYPSCAVEKKKWNWKCYICRGIELHRLSSFWEQNRVGACLGFPAELSRMQGIQLQWDVRTQVPSHEHSRRRLRVLVRHLHLNLCCGAFQVLAFIFPWSRCYMEKTKSPAFSFQPLPAGSESCLRSRQSCYCLS